MACESCPAASFAGHRTTFFHSDFHAKSLESQRSSEPESQKSKNMWQEQLKIGMKCRWGGVVFKVEGVDLGTPDVSVCDFDFVRGPHGRTQQVWVHQTESTVASREIETTVFDPASQFLSNISRRA